MRQAEHLNIFMLRHHTYLIMPPTQTHNPTTSTETANEAEHTSLRSKQTNTRCRSTYKKFKEQVKDPNRYSTLRYKLIVGNANLRFAGRTLKQTVPNQVHRSILHTAQRHQEHRQRVRNRGNIQGRTQVSPQRSSLGILGKAKPKNRVPKSPVILTLPLKNQCVYAQGTKAPNTYLSQ